MANAIEKIDGLMNNLAEAGIEIKLTRTEIADYIAAKADDYLTQELDEVQKRMNDRLDKVGSANSAPLKTVPKSVAKIVRSMKSLVPTAEVYIYFRETYGGKYEYQIGMRGGGDSPVKSFKIDVNVPDDEIPKEVPEYKELRERQKLLAHKLAELRDKKYRVVLIEKILRGTGKGQKLLNNLDVLAKSLVQA